MSRSLVGLMALSSAVFALNPANAQVTQGGNLPRPNGESTPAPSNGGGPVTNVPPPIGFDIVPGVAFVPVAFSEIGYASNINRSYIHQDDSAFIRSGAAINLTSVSQEHLAKFSASASGLKYFNEAEFGDDSRFAGNVRGSLSYLLQPHWTATAVGFYDYDGQNLNRNQSAGTSVELANHEELYSNFLRGRFQDVRYLDDTSPDFHASPLFLNSTFSYNRKDITWGGLVGKVYRLSPYAEVSAAQVDYTHQPDPTVLNRDADDFYAKGGVRVRLSPELSTDVGWRWNWRNTEDRVITNFSSNFFDGALTWRPSQIFLFTGAVEQTIGEPSNNKAALADVRSYTVKATYLPVDGVTVSVAGGWQNINEVGGNARYNANYADAQISWDYNNHTRFYTALHYQTEELRGQYLDYNVVRVLTGARIIPDGQDLLEGEDPEQLFARLKDSRLPRDMEVTAYAGYSWFGLPDVKFATIVGGPFFDQALGQVTNDDGDFSGARIDARLANFASSNFSGGHRLSFGLSGFYANYQGKSRSHCAFSLTTDCVLANITDFSPSEANNTGPFGDLNIVTKRNVNYYGVAVDARLGSYSGGGLKDGPLVSELWPLKVGVAIRGLDQTTKLRADDPLVCLPANYKEILDTHYYGGFIGIEQKEHLGGGWALSLDATAGWYYADTDYQGRYSGYTPMIGQGYVQEFGAVNQNFDRGSFIGTLRLGVNRELGWGTFGLYGQGEYLSYVPRIIYNNNDQADFLSFPVFGTQQGTRIKSDDAFNYTGGVRFSVRLD